MRPRLEAVFFRSDNGNEPVRAWLLSLPKADRKAIGDDVLKVQYGWPVGMPLVGGLGAGLWEVRSRLKGRIARIMFCIEGSTMVLLHGFIKKTQKTQQQDIALALSRMARLRHAI